MIRIAIALAVIVPLLFQPLLAVSPEIAARKLLSKRLRIERIEVEGNQTFDDKTVKKNMYAHEDGFWQSVGLMGSNRYTKQHYERDPVLLEYFYRSEGFDDVEVSIELAPGTKPDRLIVRALISEGVRYTLRSVNVTGEIGAEGGEIDWAISLLKRGSPYNPYGLDIAKNSVKGVLANRGYPYADITATVEKSPEIGMVDITFGVVRNQLVLFGDVYVDSSLKTQPHVFQREIAFKRGDIYTRNKYVESQQRLIRTGLFNFVSLNLKDSMSTLDSLQPDFYISAVERPPKFVGVGVGGAQDREAGVALNLLGRFGDRNIGGTARSANFSVTTAFTAKDSIVIKPTYQFLYVEPYLLKTRMPLTATVKYEPRILATDGAYKLRVLTIDATVVREFSLISKLSTSANFEKVDLIILKPDTLERTAGDIRRDQGINVYRRFIFLFERDSRPLQSRFNPSSGSYTSYRLEFVGGFIGGDASFVKLVYNWAKYNRLGAHTIFASRIKLGWVTEFGVSEAVPVKERFYLGGAYTVRGFPENELSPHEGEETVGGEAIILMNLELRKPLIGPVWWSYFIDTGMNVPWIRAVGFGEVALTTGVGIQYMSPVGPIRLDLGQRIGINGFDAGAHFHIGILYAF